MDKNNPQKQEQWRALMTSSYTAMTAQKYEDVVNLSTECLDEFMEDYVLRILCLRSTANEKRGLLSRALEDAIRMVESMPTSASGYLRIGSIHLASGQSDLAVHSFNQGLDRASKTDPEYTLLKEERDKAFLRAKSRFDIIANLPVELVYKVLSCLKMNCIWVCVTVSPRWCEQTLRSGTWWNSVTIRQTLTPLDRVICDALPLVKDYIHTLVFDQPTTIDFSKRYLRYFKFGAFRNLKALSLEVSFCQSMEHEDFAIVLWEIRHTLTSLKVEFVATRRKPFRLLSIFSTCPDIEELSYTTSGAITFTAEEDNNYALGVACKKLSSLELSFSEITYDALCSHLALCPGLSRLILKSPVVLRLADFANSPLTDFCSKLKVLGLNQTKGLPSAKESKRLSVDANGIAYMGATLGRHISVQQCATLIQAQSSTLVRLHIDYSEKYHQGYYPGDYPDNFTSTRFTNLTTLHYASVRDNLNHSLKPIESFIGIIIQNSPKLTELSLSCIYPCASFRDIVMQAAKTIRSLTFDTVSFHNTNARWYQSLFSSLDRVQNLVIQNCDFLDDDVLPNLESSRFLQRLTITQCHHVSSEGLTKFLKQTALRFNHQLQALYLNGLLAALTMQSLRFIVRIRTLKVLRVTNDISIDAGTVNDLIDQAPCTGLKSIEILDCFPSHIAVSWSDSVSHLKKKGITLVIE